MKAILFDLDGTLLPMNQDAFIETYFRELSLKLQPYGFEQKRFVESMWVGIMAMLKNNGACNNETAFWAAFSKACGENILLYTDVFEEFYHKEFENAKIHTGFQPLSKPLVEKMRKRGYRIVLATSPVYPKIGVEKRLNWAGLEIEDFDYVSTYENSSFCKPNPAYYVEVAEKLGVSPEDCVMVGNDTRDDLPAAQTGMQVFLLTDYLINKENVDFSAFPHGDFDTMYEFLENV